MTKTPMQKVAAQKRIEIEVPGRFPGLATRYGLTVEYLAKSACDLFADNPPSEIIFADDPKAETSAKRKTQLAA